MLDINTSFPNSLVSNTPPTHRVSIICALHIDRSHANNIVLSNAFLCLQRMHKVGYWNCTICVACNRNNSRGADWSVVTLRHFVAPYSLFMTIHLSTINNRWWWLIKLNCDNILGAWTHTHTAIAGKPFYCATKII